MSTHPTILGDMIKNETEADEKTSLDVERDLGIPTDAGRDKEETATARPALLDPDLPPGQQRQRRESE